MPLIETDAEGRIPMGELTLADIELAGMYRECAVGKAALIDAVRVSQ